MVKPVDKRARKSEYFNKLTQHLDNYSKVFIVAADCVSANQMHETRHALRHRAVFVMGKNTLMRRTIREHAGNISGLEKLLPMIRHNVGLIFTNEDLCEIREVILSNKKRAPARPGAIAPCTVTVPAMNTGIGPEKTSFFQALQIPTKIARGSIEIVNDIQLLKEGDKVGLNEATLLNMLDISPFTYGLVITSVYDQGTVFPPHVLDIKPEDVFKTFQESMKRVTALSLALNYPTVSSVPHSIVNGFKNLLAISAATDYTFKEAETLKSILSDPSKLAAMQAAASAASGPAAAATETAAEATPAAPAPVEEEEESDEDMGFGLFD